MIMANQTKQKENFFSIFVKIQNYKVWTINEFLNNPAIKLKEAWKYYYQVHFQNTSLV